MHQFTAYGAAVALGMTAAYILLTVILTIKLRSKTTSEFMVAARAMPAVVVGGLLMSEYTGVQSTVGIAQEAFNSGIAASWSLLGASLGFFLFGLIMVRYVYTSGAYTISGAMEKRYGKSTMITVSLIMIYSLLLVNVGAYIGGAAVLSAVMNLDITWSILAIAVASTFFIFIGGMKGVAWVTLVHTSIKLTGLGILLYTALSLTKGVQPLMATLPSDYFTSTGKIGLPTIGAWTIGTVGAIFSTQHLIQAVASNRTPDAARRSCFYAALFSLPLGIVLATIGVCAKYLYPKLESLYALPVFLSTMNPITAGFVTTALFASVLISVSTVALGITSLVVRDFYVPWAQPTPEQELRVSRVASLAVGFAPLILVFFLPGILKLSFFTRALRLSVSLAAVIGFSLPRFATNRGGTLALIGSAVGTTAWFLLGDPYGIDNMYIAILLPVAIIAVDNMIASLSGRRFSQSAMAEDHGS